MMEVFRAAGSAFEATENDTDDSPCPSPEASVIHAASALAVHWHSRLVAMRTVPDPPAGGKDAFSELIVTAHLTADGPVVVSRSEEEPQAAATSASAASAERIAASRTSARVRSHRANQGTAAIQASQGATKIIAAVAVTRGACFVLELALRQ